MEQNNHEFFARLVASPEDPFKMAQEMAMASPQDLQKKLKDVLQAALGLHANPPYANPESRLLDPKVNDYWASFRTFEAQFKRWLRYCYPGIELTWQDSASAEQDAQLGDFAWYQRTAAWLADPKNIAAAKAVLVARQALKTGIQVMAK